MHGEDSNIVDTARSWIAWLNYFRYILDIAWFSKSKAYNNCGLRETGKHVNERGHKNTKWCNQACAWVKCHV